MLCQADIICWNCFTFHSIVNGNYLVWVFGICNCCNVLEVIWNLNEPSGVCVCVFVSVFEIKPSLIALQWILYATSSCSVAFGYMLYFVDIRNNMTLLWKSNVDATSSLGYSLVQWIQYYMKSENWQIIILFGLCRLERARACVCASIFGFL